MKRDGKIDCVGSVIESYPRKIGRCVRSTLDAEGTSAASVLELSIWIQAYLCELLMGGFFDMRVSLGVNLSLANPFSDAPVDSDVAKKFDSVQQMENCRGCRRCQKEVHLAWDPPMKSVRGCLECEDSKDPSASSDFVHPLGLTIGEMPPIKIIGFTDSANAYASVVANLQPKSVRKLTRIAIAFLRDLTSRISYSLSDAHWDIDDCGTKRGRNLGIFLRGTRERRFCFSFLGRGNMKLLKFSARR